MDMYTLIISISVGLLIAAGVWAYAYRLGLRHGRSTSVPFRLIDELLDHKIHCCGQDPATARVELETSLDIEAWESQSLLQHVLRSPRHSPRQGDNAGRPAVTRTKKVA